MKKHKTVYRMILHVKIYNKYFVYVVVQGEAFLEGKINKKLLTMTTYGVQDCETKLGNQNFYFLFYILCTSKSLSLSLRILSLNIFNFQFSFQSSKSIESHSLSMYFPGIIPEVDMRNRWYLEALRKQGLLPSVFPPQAGN